MHTCWCRHWPPGGLELGQAAEPLVFQAMVEQVPGAHEPDTVPAWPKQTSPVLLDKPEMVPTMPIVFLPGIVLVPSGPKRVTSVGTLRTVPSGIRCSVTQ